uniref:Protein CASC3 n=1 Tax=Lepeophtheirus salmonis TaxID=72036 RepID=A0A0K2TE39_LEPSM
MSDQNKENRSRSASKESHISERSVSPHEKEEVEEEEEQPKEDEDENSDYASAHEEESPKGEECGEGEEGALEEAKEEGKTGGVDDDQDRRNPQYIPKRGVFYEHDDRIDSEEEEEEVLKKGVGSTLPGRRVPKSEASCRWGHDKFAEMDQSPKTKDELVSVYGYDIRNEDTAPRARRRRKYGRGPNKYTRKWENEDAYVKSSGRGGQSHKGSRGGSIIIKKTGKRIVPEEELPNNPESKEIPPPAQKNEDIKSSKSYSKEQQSFKKDSNKVRPEHTGKTFHSKTIDSSSSKVEHLEKSLSRTHINNRQSLPPRRSYEKNNSNQLTTSHTSVEILPTKPKRYSTQRQRNNNGASSRKDDTTTSNSTYYKRGNTFQTNSSDYPTTSVAYSNSTPFASTTTGGSVFHPSRSSQGGGPPPTAQTVPPPYMNPNGLVNYGPPPPVQYTVPVTVPVTVPLTMSLVPPQPENYSGVPLVPGPTTANPPLLPPTAHHIGAPELMAAAALGGGVPTGNGAPPNTGYAEVRGGVTYFNPTVQAPILMRPVNKRPKAAIPIIDPSNLSVEKTLSSCETSDTTVESSDKNSVDIMASTSNESAKLVT